MVYCSCLHLFESHLTNMKDSRGNYPKLQFRKSGDVQSFLTGIEEGWKQMWLRDLTEWQKDGWD